MSKTIWSTVSKINFFEKFFQKYIQSVKWIRLDFIRVQTVCKDYQQTTNVVAAGKELTERNTQFYVTKTVAKHLPTTYSSITEH